MWCTCVHAPRMCTERRLLMTCVHAPRICTERRLLMTCVLRSFDRHVCAYNSLSLLFFYYLKNQPPKPRSTPPSATCGPPSENYIKGSADGRNITTSTRVCQCARRAWLFTTFGAYVFGCRVVCIYSEGVSQPHQHPYLPQHDNDVAKEKKNAVAIPKETTVQHCYHSLFSNRILTCTLIFLTFLLSFFIYIFFIKPYKIDTLRACLVLQSTPASAQSKRSRRQPRASNRQPAQILIRVRQQRSQQRHRVTVMKTLPIRFGSTLWRLAILVPQ